MSNIYAAEILFNSNTLYTHSKCTISLISSFTVRSYYSRVKGEHQATPICSTRLHSIHITYQYKCQLQYIALYKTILRLLHELLRKHTQPSFIVLSVHSILAYQSCPRARGIVPLLYTDTWLLAYYDLCTAILLSAHHRRYRA